MITWFDWFLFHIIIGILLVIDLFTHRKAHAQSSKEALIWSIIWISVAMVFALYISDKFGSLGVIDYTTAYIVEKMLSIDNLFVFAVIFTYFGIEKRYEHKILFYGVVGAIIFRALFIFAGIHLIESFRFMTYIFGVALLYTGYRMLKHHGTPTDPSKSPIIRYIKKFFTIHEEHNGRFFISIQGKRVITPLFITLVVIESTDILFAIDSVPAVLSITHDLFVAYTSNIFAVLGLRSLYFLLINMLERLKYLHVGLFVLLMYLGTKIIISNFIEIPTLLSLGIVGAILIITTIISLRSKDS